MTDAARRQAALDRAQARGRLPSAVGAVVRDGRATWVGSAGTHGGPDLQYRIGSITKTMTAVLVMQCRDDGLLSLADPLSAYLPEAGYGEATLRELLSHTSGMQSEPVGPWWERAPGVAVAELLAANDGSGRVLRAGEAFHYSNLGFGLLGEVVARVRGAAWWDLVRSRLLEPLDLGRTTYDPIPGEHAQGYSVDHFAGTLSPEPHEDTGAMAPAGQLWSTVADLARWLDLLATGHGDVVAPATLAEMARSAEPGEGYGLGLRRLGGSPTLVGHTGSMPGFLATAFVDRATRTGVIGLCNATTGVVTDGWARDLLDGTDVPAPAPWVPTDAVPAGIEEVLGLWFWGNSAQELRWHNGSLELRDLTDPDDVDRFVLDGTVLRGSAGYHLGETLHVQRDEAGRVRALECATFRYTRAPSA
jgi:CubicO group peptidase (beta-lactamase class C family)